MRMVEVQAVDGGSPRHRSCVGRGKQHHSDREGYEGERAKARVGYLIAEGERTSTLVTLFAKKAPTRWMRRLPSCATIYLVKSNELRVIGDGNVV
jgi:hypothetical protein